MSRTLWNTENVAILLRVRLISDASASLRMLPFRMKLIERARAVDVPQHWPLPPSQAIQQRPVEIDTRISKNVSANP